VTWRDGVHLTGTPIWCDARRRRDVCFVSSADRLGRGGHGQLIATPLTLALLGANSGGADLAVPVRKRFTLGTLRLELIPSGRGAGAAALLVDLGGRTTLYAGAVRSAKIGSCEPAEVRACDALVVHAPFGEQHHAFPRLDQTIAKTAAWVKAELAAERRPVLFCDSALDGLEIATELAARGTQIAAGRRIRELAGRAKVTNITTPGKEPRAVVWLDTDHAGLAKALAGKRFATALASGRAVEGADGYDTSFVWAAAADRAQLLAWIDSANAREVFVTGACADAIAAAVGPKARVVGPPRQMALFAP
jgi:putative mRNA 3-end processing factor